MIAQHESFQTNPERRGEEFGAALSVQVVNTIDGYSRLFLDMHGFTADDIRALGVSAGEFILSQRPEAYAEIAGIAAGAGVDRSTLLAINARTELFAGNARPECSVIGAGSRATLSEPILAQNWDWHPSAERSLVVWTVNQPDGEWFATLTEAGILGKIGLNSRGLAVAINILSTTADGLPMRGLPIHVMLRSLLEDCASTDEAQGAVVANQYSASTAITVLDASGEDVRTFEVSPVGVGLAKSEIALAHTNHFTLPLDAVDIGARDWPGSLKRLDLVEASLSNDVTVQSTMRALRTHDPAGVCDHELDATDWADLQQTMASVLIRPQSKSMLISDGPPCVNDYVEYEFGTP